MSQYDCIGNERHKSICHIEIRHISGDIRDLKLAPLEILDIIDMYIYLLLYKAYDASCGSI